MEYNKDEAARAREIAKTKFLANDLMGARRFAMKAHNMYPELEGIAQMVATFDVHLSAKNIVHGEVDYYAVLGVSPEADDETVRTRYKTLAVLLHPDGNKTVGAEEAFTFLSKAWSVFSDKAKRAEYDMKRHLGMHKGRGASSSSSPPQPLINIAQRVNTTKVNTCSMRSIIRASEASASASASAAAVAHNTTAGGATFWTVCGTCKTQYEYHRIYVKQNLRCLNCRTPFIAVETDPPGSGWIRKRFNEHEFDSFRRATDGRKKRAAGASSANATKRRKVLENGVACSNAAGGSNTVKDLSEEDIKNVLKKKLKPLISRKLQELCVAVPETVAVDANGRSMDAQSALDALVPMLMESIPDDEDVNSLGALTVEVPEPDFCDFDKDRSEESFADNEIWACYDSVDGMPRSYVMVRKVISAEPFKVRMVRLTSETNNDLRSTKWLGSGIAKTCGEFRASKTQTCRSPYVFSHKVKLIQGSHGEFLIYPQKGHVWALYRNWSPDWTYLKEGVEYDLVEVVEGYTEEHGVSVVPLVKVAGFKSVFHHHVDANEVTRILKDDIPRFSHRIPSFLLAGSEAADAPRGCTQLDPAATPSELLQVIHQHL